MFRGLFDSLRDLVSSAADSVIETLSSLVGIATDDIEELDNADIGADDFEQETDESENEFEAEDGETTSGNFDVDYSDFVSQIEDTASELEDNADILESIREQISDGLERNLHPSELAREIGYVGDLMPGLEEYTDELIEQYEKDLVDKLDLSYSNSDVNWTERESYGSYDALIDYLETFNGGFPDDDIIDIVLTDEGFLLYVEIDSA